MITLYPAKVMIFCQLQANKGKYLSNFFKPHIYRPLSARLNMPIMGLHDVICLPF